jgi:ribose/xylose/arabinose/galactoside ABC-type transport system permease subunit
LKNNSLLLFLIALIIAGYFLSDVFFTFDNIINLLRQMAIVGILSCGITFCIIAGNIDLSYGSVVSMAAVSSILLQPINWIFAVAITLIAGLLVGVVNGLIVGRTRSNSLIVTLGMMAVIQSVSLQISGGGEILTGDRYSAFSFIGKGYILNVPVPIIIFTVIALFSYFVLSKSRFGKYVYSIGCNEQISWVSGIKVDNVRLGTFIIMSVFAAIAGIVLASRLTGARAYDGTVYLFDALTAVILGGVSLKGGRGGIGNTIIGVLVIGVLGNIFILLGMDYSFQQFTKGFILILAILINIFFRRSETSDE